MTKHQQRKQAEQKGRWAELWVSVILFFCFYKRLEHRHRNPFGEIDLIFCRRNLLLFVEVKYRQGLGRRSHTFDDVELLMPHPRQRLRLAQAAHYYYSRHPEHHHKQVRFDLVVVHPSGWLWWFANSIMQNDK